MGTPDFAVPSLRKLINSRHSVVGVVTATDKVGGRGKKQVLQSAVKREAIAHAIPVLQPEKLRDAIFLEELRKLRADLFVIVAFRMLPEVIWSMPPKGTFNLHGSLLPKYRGAAPINWAIIRGEKETGATTFFLQKEIDTGDIIFQQTIPIQENDTAGDLHDRMMELGADLVLRTTDAIAEGNVTTTKQDDRLASPAPKIFHETCEIDFDRPAYDVHNFIRGLSPYPGAWTTFDGKECKILRTTKDDTTLDLPAGRFQPYGKNELRVACRTGHLKVQQLQLQGRRRMETADFLNGYIDIFDNKNLRKL